MKPITEALPATEINIPGRCCNLPCHSCSRHPGTPSDQNHFSQSISMTSWTRHGSVLLQKYARGSRQQPDQCGLRCHHRVPCQPARHLAVLLPPVARAELQFLPPPDSAALPGGSGPVISAHTQTNARFLEKAQQGCAQASRDTRPRSLL